MTRGLIGQLVSAPRAAPHREEKAHLESVFVDTIFQDTSTCLASIRIRGQRDSLRCHLAVGRLPAVT